jgi:hypothetical protein
MSELNRNQLIHKIKEYLPNETIRFKKHEITGDLEIWFPLKNSIMTISDGNNFFSWDEIRRHIDAKMSNAKSEDCSICLTPEIQKVRVSCPKCANNWCMNCYVSIYRTNKGLMKCPFCRWTYGKKVPEHIVEMGVQQILKRFNA